MPSQIPIIDLAQSFPTGSAEKPSPERFLREWELPVQAWARHTKHRFGLEFINTKLGVHIWPNVTEIGKNALPCYENLDELAQQLAAELSATEVTNLQICKLGPTVTCSPHLWVVQKK